MQRLSSGLRVNSAKETANLSHAQILQQAGTAMVAQTNQAPGAAAVHNHPAAFFFGPVFGKARTSLCSPLFSINHVQPVLKKPPHAPKLIATDFSKMGSSSGKRKRSAQHRS